MHSIKKCAMQFNFELNYFSFVSPSKSSTANPDHQPELLGNVGRLGGAAVEMHEGHQTPALPNRRAGQKPEIVSTTPPILSTKSLCYQRM
jgi:hypothetical protein